MYTAVSLLMLLGKCKKEGGMNEMKALNLVLCFALKARDETHAIKNTRKPSLEGKLDAMSLPLRQHAC